MDASSTGGKYFSAIANELRTLPAYVLNAGAHFLAELEYYVDGISLFVDPETHKFDYTLRGTNALDNQKWVKTAMKETKELLGKLEDMVYTVSIDTPKVLVRLTHVQDFHLTLLSSASPFATLCSHIIRFSLLALDFDHKITKSATTDTFTFSVLDAASLEELCSTTANLQEFGQDLQRHVHTTLTTCTTSRLWQEDFDKAEDLKGDEFLDVLANPDGKTQMQLQLANYMAFRIDSSTLEENNEMRKVELSELLRVPTKHLLAGVSPDDQCYTRHVWTLESLCMMIADGVMSHKYKYAKNYDVFTRWRNWLVSVSLDPVCSYTTPYEHAQFVLQHPFLRMACWYITIVHIGPD